jgi:hypothetical protein
VCYAIPAAMARCHRGHVVATLGDLDAIAVIG